MTRFVLFDIGGVLADVSLERAVARCEELGYDRRIYQAIEASGAKAAGDRGDVDAAGMRQLAQAYAGIELPLPVWLDIWGAAVWWRPWIGDVFARLAVPYGALSTICPWHAEVLGPPAGADPVIFSCESKLLKPDPAAFVDAAARVGLPAAEIRYLDDRADNVASARSVGLDARRVQDRAGVLEALDGLLTGPS